MRSRQLLESAVTRWAGSARPAVTLADSYQGYLTSKSKAVAVLHLGLQGDQGEQHAHQQLTAHMYGLGRYIRMA